MITLTKLKKRKIRTIFLLLIFSFLITLVIFLNIFSREEKVETFSRDEVVIEKDYKIKPLPSLPKEIFKDNKKSTSTISPQKTTIEEDSMQEIDRLCLKILDEIRNFFDENSLLEDPGKIKH